MLGSTGPSRRNHLGKHPVRVKLGVRTWELLGIIESVSEYLPPDNRYHFDPEFKVPRHYPEIAVLRIPRTECRRGFSARFDQGEDGAFHVQPMGGLGGKKRLRPARAPR